MHNSLIFSNFECNFKIRKSMKKLDSNQDKDSLLEELKRLRKENKKLGLSVYHDDQPCKDKKYAMVVDNA